MSDTKTNDKDLLFGVTLGQVRDWFQADGWDATIDAASGRVAIRDREAKLGSSVLLRPEGPEGRSAVIRFSAGWSMDWSLDDLCALANDYNTSAYFTKAVAAQGGIVCTMDMYVGRDLMTKACVIDAIRGWPQIVREFDLRIQKNKKHLTNN